MDTIFKIWISFHIGHCTTNATNPMPHLTYCHYFVFAYSDKLVCKFLTSVNYLERLAPKLKILCPFTLGIKTNVQLKSSIPIDANFEISPKGFPLKVKVEIEKIFSIYANLVINVELYGLVSIGPKAGKRIPLNLEANLKPLGSKFQHLLISQH